MTDLNQDPGHCRFVRELGIRYPIIGGPMYPCSNPELVAAVSEAGGIGVIQPLSLTYVHGYEFATGLDYLRSLTDQPLGFNVLIDSSSRRYRQRMEGWIEQALEGGIRFFITSLGKPDWVVRRVHAAGGRVYHDASEAKWAQIGVDCGVDGLICVNNRAGGHLGSQSAEALYQTCVDLGKPLVCAGGVANAGDVRSMLDLGYVACQLGTRFIASEECSVSKGYKQAIIKASEEDICSTLRMTGVPVAVIRPGSGGGRCRDRTGWMRPLLENRRTRRLLRMLLSLRAARRMKQSIREREAKDWSAGKSVAHIDRILPVAEILQQLARGIPAKTECERAAHPMQSETRTAK